ncbi:cytochrome P450 [Allobranchiibius sp. GilTou38]|uniref:cytochrome P450 n=1 Tax=Allobranchiibius sp. GilTou38 TaxID=2815210 RepID=UPI0032607DBC
MLRTSASRRFGLSAVTVLPKKFLMPLRREGLDPMPQLAQQRVAEPVTRFGRVFGITLWLVTGYEETRRVLDDRDSYSTDIRPFMGAGSSTDIGGLGFTDAPEHTRLRKMLTPEFTGRRIAAFLPNVERIVQEQLDRLEAQDGVVDLVSDFAFPVPFAIICELLGLPVEERERFRELGRTRFDVNGGGQGTFGAMSDTQEFLLDEVRRQRVAPGPGLIGNMIRTHGDQIDDVALAGLCDGVFTGGYETSASMLALGALVILQRPDAAALARDDVGLDRLIEELLRYLSVVQIAFPRFALEDMDLFGHDVAKGDVVICSLSGANRDASFGADSEMFSTDRQRQSHLAFGRGIHRCVGAELARMEMRVAFRAFVRRFPDAVLAAEAGSLNFHDLSIVYGVQSLPVRLGATSTAHTMSEVSQ